MCMCVPPNIGAESTPYIRGNTHTKPKFKRGEKNEDVEKLKTAPDAANIESGKGESEVTSPTFTSNFNKRLGGNQDEKNT